jgi:hypothetical protein
VTQREQIVQLPCQQSLRHILRNLRRKAQEVLELLLLLLPLVVAVTVQRLDRQHCRSRKVSRFLQANTNG